MPRFFTKAFVLLEKVQTLDQDKIMMNILKDSSLQAQIIDLNQSQLYNDGKDADGNVLGDYSPSTIKYWKPLAASEGRDGRTDHITLKDTGDFYGSMKVKVEPGSFTIQADDEKPGARPLTAQYGKSILGLTNESKAEIIPEIRIRMVEAMRAHLKI